MLEIHYGAPFCLSQRWASAPADYRRHHRVLLAKVAFTNTLLKMPVCFGISIYQGKLGSHPKVFLQQNNPQNTWKFVSPRALEDLRTQIYPGQAHSERKQQTRRGGHQQHGGQCEHSGMISWGGQDKGVKGVSAPTRQTCCPPKMTLHRLERSSSHWSAATPWPGGVKKE